MLATSEGLFEVDVQEMPNMVRATGLPRQIVHAELRDGFTVARYIEDPFVLGERPGDQLLAGAALATPHSHDQEGVGRSRRAERPERAPRIH